MAAKNVGKVVVNKPPLNPKNTKLTPGKKEQKSKNATEKSSKKKLKNSLSTASNADDQNNPVKTEEQLQKEQAAASSHVKKRTYSEYGNLIQANFSDNWDESLIPQVLIDEIYAEMMPEDSHLKSSSSYEIYDHVTESGTIVQMYRRKKKDVEVDQTEFKVKILTVEDIARNKLKKLYNREQLKDLIEDMQFQVDYNKAENHILENTMQKMLQRDMEIEAALPEFKFTIGANREGQKIIEKITDDVCMEELSSDEENTTGIYESFNPVTDIHDDDKYFENMSEKSRIALQEYLRTLDEVAPSNFDAIRHRYGELVRPTGKDVLQDQLNYLHEKASHHHHGNHHHQNHHPGKSADDKDEEKDKSKNDEEGESETEPSGALLMEKAAIDPQDYLNNLEEQDPDFPDFILRLAKQLPVEQRLKYGRNEEAMLRANYERIETREALKEKKVVVYTDTYTASFKLLKTIEAMLQRTIRFGYHPMTGKMKAEDLIRFRRRMRNMILAEETKLTMVVNEYRKRKNQVDRQVKDNKDLGESIQAIDYDQFRISNLQYQHKIDEQHEQLKLLKIITASQFEVLKKLKFKVHKKVVLYNNLEGNIEVRNTLKQSFDKNYAKYHATYQTIKDHNNFLQKRLRQFRAPSTMDYMNSRKMAKKLDKDVLKLRLKLDAVRSILEGARLNFQNIETKFPEANIKKRNTDWLKSIKDEGKKEKLVLKYTVDYVNPTGGSMKNFLGKHQHLGKQHFKEERERDGKELNFKRPENDEEGDGGRDSPPKMNMFDTVLDGAADESQNQPAPVSFAQSIVRKGSIAESIIRESIMAGINPEEGAVRQSTVRRESIIRQSIIAGVNPRQSIIPTSTDPRQSIVPGILRQNVMTNLAGNRQSVAEINPATGKNRRKSEDVYGYRTSIPEIKPAPADSRVSIPGIKALGARFSNPENMPEGERRSIPEANPTNNLELEYLKTKKATMSKVKSGLASGSKHAKGNVVKYF